MTADVAVGRAINGIAHRHVVSGDGFRNRAGGAADAEEPAGDLLASADFGEGAVGRGIQIDAQGLLMRAGDFLRRHIFNVSKRALETSLNSFCLSPVGDEVTSLIL